MKNLIIINILLLSFQANAASKPNIPLDLATEPPLLLSKTGLFKNPVENLQPAVKLINYEINQPLWVDFSRKTRFIYIPDGQKVAFKSSGPWKFPVGTVIVKHFEMEISKGVFQKIETRLLVRKTGNQTENWVGYTYQWIGADDAHLVQVGKSPIVKLKIHSSASGGARDQDFKIPSRTQCLLCHNETVGYVRSVRTEQLNRVFGGKNQLEVLNDLKIFKGKIPILKSLPSYSGINDVHKSKEHRVKSYLSVNCAHCHNSNPASMCSFTGIDLRFSEFNPTSLEQKAFIKAGSKEKSEIYKRMNSSRPFHRMPYIGTSIPHDEALDLVGEWIDEL